MTVSVRTTEKKQPINSGWGRGGDFPILLSRNTGVKFRPAGVDDWLRALCLSLLAILFDCLSLNLSLSSETKRGGTTTSGPSLPPHLSSPRSDPDPKINEYVFAGSAVNFTRGTREIRKVVVDSLQPSSCEEVCVCVGSLDQAWSLYL